MCKKYFVAFAIVLNMVFHPASLMGQSSSQGMKAKPGFKWLVFASREDLAEASRLARSLSAVRSDIRVFKSTSGWHAIAAGPLPMNSAQSTLSRLVASGAVPPDSYLSEGGRFVEDVTTQAMAHEVSAPSSKEIEQAVNLLSDAFRTPIEPTLRKEVHNGVMLFYNATVYKQAFSGDGTRLRYTFSEEITQETEPGLGGSYRTTSRQEGEVAFKDLQHAWIHGDENEPNKRRITLNCLGGRACASLTSEGRSWKSGAVDLMFRDDETAKNALLALDTLMRANK